MTAQREWFEKDYYAVLGVAAGVSDKELSKAYKQLAKRYHPDANAGDAAAEERFKEISAAYDVLGDPKKRAEYDEVRRMAAAGAGPGGAGGFGPGGFGGGFGPGAGGARFEGDLGGLFGNLFGGGRRGRRPAGPEPGQDLETELHLSFDAAVHGITAPVRFRSDASCSTCSGSGAAPGTQPETCGECGGHGAVAVDQGPFSFSQPCGRCGGRGQVVAHPCPTCRGRGVEVRSREVKVRVPAGVADGQRIRVKGRGAAGANGGPPGDLYVVVRVQPDAVFGRSGRDLTVRLPVAFAEAAMGASVRVPTLGDPVTVRIPPGTPAGKVLRVRGRGVPAEGRKEVGDLLVTVEVQVPTGLTDEQRAAIDALGRVLDADPRAELFAANERRTNGAA
ncbi:MAG: molecular chaperone DnaJ [Actinomycetota bacterium]